MELCFRVAAISDLQTIVSIYNASIDDGLATADIEHQTIESKKDWFLHHTEKYPVWIIELHEISIGWLSIQPFYGRPAYEHTVELSLYLHPDYKGIGYGRKALEIGIEESKKLGHKNLLGFIFSHNTPSMKLFTRVGFVEWGMLPEIAEMPQALRSLVIMGLKV